MAILKGSRAAPPQDRHRFREHREDLGGAANVAAACSLGND